MRNAMFVLASELTANFISQREMVYPTRAPSRSLFMFEGYSGFEGVSSIGKIALLAGRTGYHHAGQEFQMHKYPPRSPRGIFFMIHLG